MLLSNLSTLRQLRSLRRNVTVRIVSLILRTRTRRVTHNLVTGRINIGIMHLGSGIVKALGLTTGTKGKRTTLTGQRRIVTLLGGSKISRRMQIMIILVTMITISNSRLGRLASLQNNRTTATIIRRRLLRLLNGHLSH